MFFEILFFLFLGILIGVIFGLLPGVHPNTIIIFIPLLASLNLETPLLLAFIVSVAVSNSITSFLPSILLSVPDSGNELSILPGHRMLLDGYGYQAVKLTVVGSIGAVILCAAASPFLVVIVPFLFDILANYIYLLLITIAAIMVFSEQGKKKLIALALFFASGVIGIISSRIPIDNTLILFPIFSGFFGIGMLMLQIRNSVEIPKQHQKEVYVSRGLINSSVISGSIAGVFSGLLPGVGASEIASLASVDRNGHAFLVRIGAITTANIILSILGLWLIGKSRSGMAVVIEQLAGIGLEESIIILIITLISGGVAAVCTLAMAKKSLLLIKNFSYRTLAIAVLLFVAVLTYMFAGLYGMLLLVVCSAVGMLTNLAGVKRGVLMGVLMLPTIVFYISQTA